MAGTGGTSSSKVLVVEISRRGFGVGSLEEFITCDNLATLLAVFLTEL